MSAYSEATIPFGKYIYQGSFSLIGLPSNDSQGHWAINTSLRANANTSSNGLTPLMKGRSQISVVSMVVDNHSMTFM